ncbi:hypothetical protein C8Q79DRAFT_898969 [Trametes meyenii]|nr:hypothetical protein C8Q79DRAFT_898969 [Trametes meyenii]
MHPWDIYAQELAFHGHGHPLWHPEPRADGRTVQVGDVGWLQDGAFRHLLRTVPGAEDDQTHGVVPENCTLLDLEDLYVSERRQSIQQRVLASRETRDLQLDGRTSPLTDGGTTATFGCESSTGALLALSDTRERRIESRLRIARYVLAEHTRWLSFANGTLGLTVKPEDVLFVSATTKTSRWAVAAYENNEHLEAGSFTFDIMAQAYTSQPFGLASSNAVSTHVNVPNRCACNPPHSVALAPPRYDQCVFIHFFKIKKRRPFLPSRIVAAAGPDGLPGPENDDAGKCVVAVEGVGNAEGGDVSNDLVSSSCLLSQRAIVDTPPGHRPLGLPVRLYTGGQAFSSQPSER